MNEMTVFLFTSNNQWMAIQKMIRFVFRVIRFTGLDGYRQLHRPIPD